MRVLQLHKDFEPRGGGGGTARHIHGLASALAGEGCEVRVIAPAVEAMTTPYVSVASPASGFARHIAWADVVHIHGARSSYAIRGALAAARGRKPFFYTPHAYYAGTTPRSRLAKAMWDRTAEKFMAERGAGMILLTPVWRDWLAARGIADDRTVIIPNCVTFAELPAVPAGSPQLPGSPAILSVGRLDPVKRLHDVVAALVEPPLADAHLHIVGKGVERGRLEALAVTLGVAARVTCHGFVDDAGTAAMAGGANVFVLASEQEGLPTVLLEMLAARVPLACSQIPGNLAIIDETGGGATFPVGDTAALAVAVRRAAALTVTDDNIAAMRTAFTWEARAAEIAGLYRRALAGRRTGG